MDRLNTFKSTGEKFRVSHGDTFSDGEFRGLMQFMFTGKFRKLTFEYSGKSIEAVLDKLPTAEVLLECDGIYTVKVQGYADGITMWLGSQGDDVKIVE